MLRRLVRNASSQIHVQTAKTISKTSSPSRREVPEALKISRPSEGAGNAGCALHPRSRVQMGNEKRTRAYRFSGGHPTFPAQWLYGLCSWRRIRLVTIVDELAADPRPVGPTCLRQLDTSNGCRNHTPSPYAATSFVCAPFDRSRVQTRPAIHLRA
jgi:hypothetical protein